MRVDLKENGKFSFYLKEDVNDFKLPFMIYKNINYQINLDGVQSNWSSDDNNRLIISNLKKGKHTIQVVVHKSWYDYLSYILSSLGSISLIYIWVK